MKVLVCGSRDYAHSELIWQRVEELLDEDIDLEIIAGGARGPDSQAEAVAWFLSIPCTVIEADWQSHGRKAGFMRNLKMLDLKPDLVLAFWDGNSRGTKHTIDEARKRGIPVEVIE